MQNFSLHLKQMTGIKFGSKIIFGVEKYPPCIANFFYIITVGHFTIG